MSMPRCQRQGNVAPTAEIAVRQDNVAFGQRIVELAKQAVFAGLLALVFSDRRLQHRAHRERKDHQDSGDGKAAAGLLRFLLRIGRLILRRVGHGDGGAVHHADLSPMPKPSLRRFVLDLLAGVAHQSREGLLPADRLAPCNRPRCRPSRASSPRAKRQAISRATASRQEWSGLRHCERKTHTVTAGV